MNAAGNTLATWPAGNILVGKLQCLFQRLQQSCNMLASFRVSSLVALVVGLTLDFLQLCGCGQDYTVPVVRFLPGMRGGGL